MTDQLSQLFLHKSTGDVMELVKNYFHKNFGLLAEKSLGLCYEFIQFFKFKNSINFKQSQKQVFEFDPKL